jgi:hypothetical protein
MSSAKDEPFGYLRWIIILVTVIVVVVLHMLSHLFKASLGPRRDSVPLR